MYSAKIHRPVDLLKESMAKFQPKEALQTDKFADLDGAIADAVKLKFLEQPLTKEQIAELIANSAAQKISGVPIVKENGPLYTAARSV